MYDTEYKLAVGLYDLPAEFKNGVAYIYPLRKNTAVFGTAMSGKTTFLKSLLLRFSERRHLLPEEEVYILDFGGNIGDYNKLNVVCAYFDGSNAEDVKRLFKTIDQRVKENTMQLSASNYCSMFESNSQKCPAHITLIIDNVNSMLSNEIYGNYLDKLLLYSRDGLSKGLSVIITANNTSQMGRLISNFAQKIVFSLSDDEYSEIFNTRVKALPKKNPGRGFINIDSQICEFQGFLPFSDKERKLRPDENSDETKVLLDETKGLEYILSHQIPAQNPKKLIAFPNTALTEKNLNDHMILADKPLSDEALPVITGLDYYTHHPVEIDIALQRCFAIYGKRGFGKSNLLKLLVKGILKHESSLGKIRFVCLDDGRKQLEDEELLELLPKNTENEIRYYEKFTNLKAFNEYLSRDYGGFRQSEMEQSRSGPINLNPGRPLATAEINPENPFTVFILQNKAIYQNDSLARNFAIWYNKMISDAISHNCLFIFSDVKPMVKGSALEEIFNSTLSAMFLLDNIADFVSGRGQSSVVASYMEYKELKAEFANCSLGDGYYYDVDADMLHKLKYIKYEQEEACK